MFRFNYIVLINDIRFCRRHLFFLASPLTLGVCAYFLAYPLTLDVCAYLLFRHLEFFCQTDRSAKCLVHALPIKALNLAQSSEPNILIMFQLINYAPPYIYMAKQALRESPPTATV